MGDLLFVNRRVGVHGVEVAQQQERLGHVPALALHFIVIYLGGEYETKRGFSTGIVIDPPNLFGFKLSDGRAWYFVLLAAAAASLMICINLLRSRSGRAWRAIHARETVAEMPSTSPSCARALTVA